MKRVKISDLKAHLSQYLREVQNGETIMVCDRDRPVARISGPDDFEDDVIVIRGRQNPAELRRLLENRPEPLLGFDVVAMLREDRDAE